MLYLVFTFILGTVVGSFLNVCIHRLPRGESIIHPVSHCPHCGHKLGALELIPVIGYFMVGGKCKQCKKPISFRYPLVEFLTGALMVAITLRFPPLSFPLEFFFYLIFSALMLIVFFIDFEQHVIPDSVSLSGIFLGLIFNFTRGMFWVEKKSFNPFLSSVFGMLLGYAFFYVIAKLGRLCFKKEVLGEGDLFLAALLGAYLGWRGVLLSIFLAYLLAGGTALVLLLLRKIKMGEYVPFGPALVAGGFLTLFFEKQIVDLYLRIFL